MIGAILGDIIGSPYEFDRGNKSKEFPLFSCKSTYTDDTVMTLAVGLTFLDAQPSASDDGYELNRTCDEIRPVYFHTETCMETVPEAITAFLEGDSFEDVIRTAVSLGGDRDTLTAIAGSIAEGFYGVPVELKEECYKRLPEPLLKVLKAFEEYLDR